ncbi:glycosyltransferase family 2 protein [Sphingomonas sp. BN140010]|uniref:Glycosyltransferase family 2 protein n=1 Tax=Sphingomonas arvum TaxID=2992113 RepID=A0ABT3JD29_9SPHN|nr:glycosyltransferase family 2 protein [Sphingomonas sp. BN140010]MCW3796675.1 glycosyltransferase family 2 protein [Sphingomonas sp. BN140010]
MDPFWKVFLRLLPLRPTKALEAAYWQVTGRRVRARHRLRDAVRPLPLARELWREGRASVPPAELAQVAGWHRQPRITIVIHSVDHCSPASLDGSRESVVSQAYKACEQLECTAENLARTVTTATGDHVFFLRAGDQLLPPALFRVAQAIIENPAADILFGDEEQLHADASLPRLWLKPQWNREMFLALDYLSSAMAIKTSLVQSTLARLPPSGEPLAASDILFFATEVPSSTVIHVPALLVKVAHRAELSSAARAAMIGDQLGSQAEVGTGPHNTVRVRWQLQPPHPLVSIIIPTRDKVELLTACVESVLARTDYAPFEILIVDNGSKDQATLTYMAELGRRANVRVIRSDAPYNYSALNNLAVQQAHGSFICLLNNDTEVVTPEWLTELMRYAVRPEVGAVGAKLLYADGSIQHAGVIVGMGEAAGHAHRFLAANRPGYFRQPHVAQYVSAVTAACLVVAREKFEAVGGLDEAQLAIAYNDVDLCLKLQQRGWRNVYTPHAILYHYESKSRGNDLAPEHSARYLRELRVFQERWGTRTYMDPLHNPDLDRYSETFSVNVG